MGFIDKKVELNLAFYETTLDSPPIVKFRVQDKPGAMMDSKSYIEIRFSQAMFDRVKRELRLSDRKAKSVIDTTTKIVVG